MGRQHETRILRPEEEVKKLLGTTEDSCTGLALVDRTLNIGNNATKETAVDSQRLTMHEVCV
jgi:hypothetical protein